MVDIANQQRAAELSAQRATQDAQIALMAEGAEKQRNNCGLSMKGRYKTLTPG